MSTRLKYLLKDTKKKRKNIEELAPRDTEKVNHSCKQTKPARPVFKATENKERTVTTQVFYDSTSISSSQRPPWANRRWRGGKAVIAPDMQRVSNGRSQWQLSRLLCVTSGRRVTVALVRRVSNKYDIFRDIWSTVNGTRCVFSIISSLTINQLNWRTQAVISTCQPYNFFPIALTCLCI